MRLPGPAERHVVSVEGQTDGAWGTAPRSEQPPYQGATGIGPINVF